MRNKDLMQKQKNEILQRIAKAQNENNVEEAATGWNELMEFSTEAIRMEYEGLLQESDSRVLIGRGMRQLTSEEKKWYQEFKDAASSTNPKQALADLTVVMPITIMDTVMEDVQSEHPLLGAIDFINTNGATDMFINTSSKQLAGWGTLTAAIVTELSGGFKKVSMTLSKLTAFIPVAKSMVDLGAEWLDRFIRAILAEAIAFGLEDAIINGTGKDMPIGMSRQVQDGVTVTGGVYPLKVAVPITSFNPADYGAILALLAKDGKGNERIVPEVILIVNPTDYLTKVMPASTPRASDGSFVRDVFPFPTKVIQSAQMASGKAVIGIAKRYFIGMGTAKSGKLEYDDSYHFIEDERMYAIKLYGHGLAKDDNAFKLLDVTNLEPATQRIEITNISAIPQA